MSYSYLIGPIDSSVKVEINTEYFIQQFMTKWPNGAVRQVTDQTSLEWRIKTGAESAPYGRLLLGPSVVSIDGGDLSLIAEFAVWYRSIIPSEFELYFYISSLNRDPMELRADTTGTEIQENFA